MFDGIKDKFLDYYDQIPPDTFPAIAKSAILTFSCTLLFTRKFDDTHLNISRPLFNAGIAALASSIYALTTPFFNTAFGDKDVHFHRELIKFFVNLSITSMIVGYLTSSKVDAAALPLLRIIPFKVMMAPLTWIPRFADFIGENQDAAEMRQFMQSFSMYPEPGSASIHMVF